MGKPKYYGHSNVNKLLEIEKLKRLEEKIDSTMSNIYASVAIALMEEYGWDKQQVADIICYTGGLWKECSEKGISMIEWCRELTGLDISQMAKNKSKCESKYQGSCEVYEVTDGR